MMMIDLAALFADLLGEREPGPPAGDFTGACIPGTSHHIARDERGRPVLLLQAVPTDVRPASIALENLRVEHGLRCTITSRQLGEIDDQFSVVQCQTDDTVLQRYFLDLCQIVLTGLSDTPSQRDIADRIDQIALLFQTLQEPSRRSIQGLWGELFLIVSSGDPSAMVEAWHDAACERYDFSVGEQRLEVKTSSNRKRVHHFSFEQVNPTPQVQCVIASLFVEQLTGGRTLGSLWDEIRQLLGDSPRLRARIDQIAFESLGSQWTNARAMAFDEQLARESLAFYDSRDIPRITEFPDGVTEVRFCCDLSLALPVAKADRQMLSFIDIRPNEHS